MDEPLQGRQAVVTAIGGPEVLEVQPFEVEPPGEGRVVVAVEAAAACYTDVLIRRGRYPANRRKPPFVIGYDVVGRVAAVGAGVTQWSVGDRVADLCVIGGAASHVTTRADRLVAVPDGVDAAEAESLVLSYLTAYQALLRHAHVTAGSRVLVIGASGAVGRAALDVGRVTGWEVTGVASSARSDVVTSLGAQAIAYDSPSYRAELVEAAGEGFDAVLDAAGTLPKRFLTGLLRPGGHLAVVGFAGAVGPAGGGSSLGTLVTQVRAVVASRLAGLLSRSRSASFYLITADRAQHPDHYREDLGQLLAWLADGRLEPHVEERFELADVVDAHRRLEAGGVHGRISLVLED